jgi:hypothetical protein
MSTKLNFHENHPERLPTPGRPTTKTEKRSIETSATYQNKTTPLKNI